MRGILRTQQPAYLNAYDLPFAPPHTHTRWQVPMAMTFIETSMTYKPQRTMKIPVVPPEASPRVSWEPETSALVPVLWRGRLHLPLQTTPIRSPNFGHVIGGFSYKCAFKEVTLVGGRYANEPKSSLPSKTEEASGRLTSSIAHWYHDHIQ